MVNKYIHRRLPKNISLSLPGEISLHDNGITGAICHYCLNTWRLRQNGHHFVDDISKCIYLNENVWISIIMSPKFVPKGPVNNIPALVEIMDWCQPGIKPLSEPMMVKLPTHVFIIWPQWVKFRLKSLQIMSRRLTWVWNMTHFRKKQPHARYDEIQDNEICYIILLCYAALTGDGMQLLLYGNTRALAIHGTVLIFYTIKDITIIRHQPKWLSHIYSFNRWGAIDWELLKVNYVWFSVM